GVGDSEVGNAVPVEVPHGDGVGNAAGRSGTVADRCLEGAVAVAQQHVHRAVAEAGAHQVGNAIAVKVACCHPTDFGTGGIVLSRLEGTVAAAKQHSRVGGEDVGDGEVKGAVAVEVGRYHGDRVGAGGVGLRGLEGAVAVAQQHAH